MRYGSRLAMVLALAAACTTPKKPSPEGPGDVSMNDQGKPADGAAGGGDTPAPPKMKAHEELAATCKQNLDSARALLDQIVAVKGARTVQNTLEPYNHLSIHLSNAFSKAGLFANVHPDPAMRTAGETCERDVSKFITELSLNRDVFEAIKAVDTKGAPPDAARLVERTLRDFRRAGVDKDEPTRKRIKELNEKLVEIGQRFDKTIREDVRSIEITPAQLDGLPEDYKASHPPDPKTGKVKITTDYPDYVPFRTYAKDAKARLELFKVYQSRGYPANEETLKELLATRKELASLLGYKTWADYVTEDKMIKSSKAVEEFIAKITKASDARAKKDLAILLARKRKDEPKAKVVDASESVYYEELVKRERFKFDSQEARPYFEFTQTRDGLLTITSKLFGIRYEPVPNAEVWHEDVSVFDVYEAGPPGKEKEGKKLGRIYLDLHPREGKYKHAAQFPVVNGVAGQQLPEGALVCNFPNPRTSKGPALMEHDDVVTMFHEFGHLMHHILSGRQRWVYFSGVATEWDFVEAPSQMLEEWAWDHRALSLFARHHETKEVIPEELVRRMRAASEFGKGTQVRHQMFYASMSLGFHKADDPKALDLKGRMVELQKRYSMFPYVEGTHMYASFGHLNGYSAIYYTYMWSLVIAKDLWSAFEKNGLFDEATARRYRDEVLVPGGSQDAAVLVKNFLGREYGFDSFKKWLDRD